MPPELALEFDQRQREIQGRNAQEDRDEDSSVIPFNPKDFGISTASPHFLNGYPVNTPDASWIKHCLCECGMKMAIDCDCNDPQEEDLNAPF